MMTDNILTYKEIVYQRGQSLVKKLEELKLLPKNIHTLRLIRETEALLEVNRTVFKGLK